MMDTKPIWIDGWYDTHAEAADAMQTMWRGIKLEGVPTPVLTLDQIEEWLKAEMVDAKNKAGWYGVAKLEALLAQVQAWRGVLIPKQDSGSKQN